MDERIRLRIQSDLLAAKRDISRHRNSNYGEGSGQKRLASAIERISDRISDLRLTWPSGYEPGLHGGGMGMTEFDKMDKDGDGVIDKTEWAAIELEDKRRKMEDADAQRDSQRRMAWFALFGMLLYPAGIFTCDLFGLATAANLLSDIAPTYFVAISALVMGFFGANAYQASKDK
jgi:hypothetical protein